jgi:hypothetical protein
MKLGLFICYLPNRILALKHPIFTGTLADVVGLPWPEIAYEA